VARQRRADLLPGPRVDRRLLCTQRQAGTIVCISETPATLRERLRHRADAAAWARFVELYTPFFAPGRGHPEHEFDMP
jgi:hypothetical protein